MVPRGVCCTWADERVKSASERWTRFRVQTEEPEPAGSWYSQLSGNDKHYSKLMDGRVGHRGLWCRFIFFLNTQHQIAHNLHGPGQECALSKSLTAWAVNKARVWISVVPWAGGGRDGKTEAGKQKEGADEGRRDRRNEGKDEGVSPVR